MFIQRMTGFHSPVQIHMINGNYSPENINVVESILRRISTD